MKNFLLSALLFSSSLFAAVDQGEVDQANELYQSAIVLMQGGDKSKRAETLTQLKEARELLLKQDGLSEELEDQLTKINSHIYWQTKFSTTEDFKMKSPTKKAKKSKEKGPKANAGQAFKNEAYKRWLAEKKVRENIFKTASKDANSYEKSHNKDSYSNLLNFLELQLKVVDQKNGLSILEKARLYNDRILSKEKALLQPTLDGISNYEKLLASKDYETLFNELARKIKYGNFDSKTKKVVRQYALEIQALSKMKSRLFSGISTRNSIPVPPSLIQDFEGVISKASRNGLVILSNKGVKSEIGWGVINEESICAMSLKFMDKNNPEDLFMLVVSNLRLKEYETAYTYLNSLMKLDSKNYLRYRDFLAQCETGYRLKFGEMLEKTFTRVEELSISGQVNQAYEIMNQLMDNYIDSPLGQSYHDRFSFLYQGILRT